ncbi:hypothetical protein YASMINEVIRUS_1030 [Yasminevirus sp. GU-2018]|uniref:Uncharacterized protein n=1 Tax=Yasminevirus sp. GU-2018 TaxID=2420051 RepID=A0A5K0U9C8_9VIRU|nr:hypothetical protein YASMINEVIRUS_1030 [Yasminevirus sp. GU-2018]
MNAEAVIKATLVVMFLLFAYFMIGGYTPCPDRFYPLNSVYGREFMSNCGGSCDSPRSYYPGTNSYPNNNNNSADSDLAQIGSPVPRFNGFNDMNLYQKGPYMNI